MRKRQIGSNQYRTRWAPGCDNPDHHQPPPAVLLAQLTPDYQDEQHFLEWGAEMNFQDQLELMRDDAELNRHPIDTYTRHDTWLHPLVRAYVAGRPDCPPDLLQQLVQDRQWQVRAEALANPRCPLKCMRMVTTDRETLSEAVAVANNAACPPDLLMELATSIPATSLRTAVLHNPNCDDSVVTLLVESTNPIVQYAACQHPKCPDLAIRRLWDDSKVEPTTSLAANPSCPSDLLHRATTNDSYLVRQAAAENPSCPVELLMRLLADPQPEVREAAMQNPRCPEEYRLLGHVSR
jgi:hypothetical protein